MSPWRSRRLLSTLFSTRAALLCVIGRQLELVVNIGLLSPHVTDTMLVEPQHITFAIFKRESMLLLIAGTGQLSCPT
jgi:hypothetical protein